MAMAMAIDSRWRSIAIDREIDRMPAFERRARMRDREPRARRHTRTRYRD
jgi:hypothetical protein